MTSDQRKLLDVTVLTIVREAPHAVGFTEIDARSRVKLAGIIGHLEALPESQHWSFRFTDGALQRLRKAGLVKTERKRWTAVLPTQKESV